MVKVRVTPQGIIESPGSGFEGTPTTIGSQTKTATFTLTAGDAGVLVMTASQGVLTGTMPAAAAAAGALFVFRSTSPSAHILTASAGDGNVFNQLFAGSLAGINTGSRGSKVGLPATTGASLALMSDGLHWLVIGGSGSMTFTAEAV